MWVWACSLYRDMQTPFSVRLVVFWRDLFAGDLTFAPLCLFSGGICDSAGTRNGVLQTLNTGIVTNLNYQQLIAPRVTVLTFAHEVGHNFGSDVSQLILYINQFLMLLSGMPHRAHACTCGHITCTCIFRSLIWSCCRSHSLSHTHTHVHVHTHTHTHAHSLTHALTLIHPCTHTHTHIL